MRIPAGSKGPNPLERSLPVQLVLPTPKENRVLLPFATPLARRDLLPLRRILGDAARVKLGPCVRRQVIVRSGSSRDASGFRPNPAPTGPASGGKREAARAPPLFLPSSLGRPAVVSGPGTVPVDQHSINTVPRHYTAAGTPSLSARCCYTARKCTSAPRRWRRPPRRCELALAT